MITVLDFEMYTCIYWFCYGYVILMRCFKMVFGDTPLGVYGIYVVLHVAYGQTYVKAA